MLVLCICLSLDLSSTHERKRDLCVSEPGLLHCWHDVLQLHLCISYFDT
jgi:hypothetical protein